MDFKLLDTYIYYKRAYKFTNILFTLYVIFTAILVFLNIDIIIKMIASLFVTLFFALKIYYNHKHTITKYRTISKLQSNEIISVNTELIKTYSKDEIIELTKNDQIIDLSTGYEEGVMQSVLSQHYPARKNDNNTLILTNRTHWDALLVDEDNYEYEYKITEDLIDENNNISFNKFIDKLNNILK